MRLHREPFSFAPWQARALAELAMLEYVCWRTGIASENEGAFTPVNEHAEEIRKILDSTLPQLEDKVGTWRLTHRPSMRSEGAI